MPTIELLWKSSIVLNKNPLNNFPYFNKIIKKKKVI